MCWNNLSVECEREKSILSPRSKKSIIIIYLHYADVYKPIFGQMNRYVHIQTVVAYERKSLN
jgi:hypothetical protein